MAMDPRVVMRPNPEAQFSREANARAELCKAALAALLNQYRCTIIGVPYIGPDGRIMVDVHLLPIPSERRNGDGQAESEGSAGSGR